MTRTRKRKQALKNKKAKEERLRKNPPPLPYKMQLFLKSKGLWGPPKPLREVDDKDFPEDDVYMMKEFTWKRYSLEEAINELRLLYDPSMGNKPNALVEAKIEFDMRGSKRERYLDEFSKMAPIIHTFDRGVPDRNVLAFVSDEKQSQDALDAGALRAGGEELISDIVKGRTDVADIDHFVAHEDMVGFLNPLNNVLRDKNPRPQTGTISSDVGLLVKAFARGMDVQVKKVKPELGVADEPDYGYCVVPIGSLQMEPRLIAGNLDAILEKLDEARPPKRKDPNDNAFLTRCVLRVVGESDPTAQFSVFNDKVTDKKGQKQGQAAADARTFVQRKVEEIAAAKTAQ